MCLKAGEGEKNAIKFFETSGESTQEKKGAPEALIIFTSKEVIEGKGPAKSRTIKDQWFQLQPTENVIQMISKYLGKLLKSLKEKDFSEFYQGDWIRYFHIIEVDFQDFNDCFPKIYATMNALKEKEIWINMVGGSNPINAALIMSAGFIEATAKTYYIFEPDISLLHPNIPRPNFSLPNANISLSKINILPFFSLDIGKLIRQINELFIGRGNKVNVKEIEYILNSLYLSTQYLKKLVSGGWISIQGKLAEPGEMLNRWNRMLGKAEEYPDNYPTWIKWAAKKGIIWELKNKELGKIMS